MIELRGLWKVYREGDAEHVVLRELSGVVRQGEFVALVGPSGSGKSTLLNLVSGIDLPTRGDVAISDVVVNRLSERERTLFRRKHIGFVFQFFNLIPTLTVEENLLLPLELNGRAEKQDREGALELLAAVGLRERAGAYPDRLSGGEQQRVAIARALAHDPPLLLADEPTGNLDAETGREVIELLDTLGRQRGKTLLVVTHSAELAARADRVLRLRAGAVE